MSPVKSKGYLKVGRPRAGSLPPQLNEDQIMLAASWGCTVHEIAALMGCCVDVIERRFIDIVNRGRSKLHQSLKQKQVELAMNGNTTMLIWLGKQYLGQTDKTDPNNTHHTLGVNVVVKVAEDDDWYGNKDRLAQLGINALNGAPLKLTRSRRPRKPKAITATSTAVKERQRL